MYILSKFLNKRFRYNLKIEQGYFKTTSSIYSGSICRSQILKKSLRWTSNPFIEQRHLTKFHLVESLNTTLVSDVLRTI